MKCESCENKNSKVIREINTGATMTNIFLCGDCNDAYEAAQSNKERVA